MGTEDGRHAAPPTVCVSIEAGTDSEVLERQTRRLRAELAEVDGVVSAALARDGAGGPARAKVADPVTAGAILVALSASGGVFTTVIAAVRDWLARNRSDHRITVTIDGDSIELDRATFEQQRTLVDAFLRRHTAGV